MKAIPTHFNGTLFRSRLEARWAMFFDELGVSAFYEPWDIGHGYVPDFFLHGFSFNKELIAEIKPITPNNHYIEYLKKVRIPGKSDIFIFVGNPSLNQPDGIHISGSKENYIQKGFRFLNCEHCGFYGVELGSWTSCDCDPNRPKSNWIELSEKANNFRFDLYDSNRHTHTKN